MAAYHLNHKSALSLALAFLDAALTSLDRRITVAEIAQLCLEHSLQGLSLALFKPYSRRYPIVELASEARLDIGTLGRSSGSDL